MNENDIELSNYGRIARRSWWVLALGAILGVLLAVFLLPAQSTFHESQISVLLIPGDSDNGQGQDPINEETEIGIAISQVIGDRVVAQTDGLGLDEWSENLVISACLNSENIVLDDACSSQILQFTYQGDSAEQAEEVVLLTADTYLSFRRDREQALRSETVTNLEAEFDGLDVRGETERAAFLVADEDSLEAELIERRLREIEDTKLTVVSQLTELRSRSSEVGSLLGDPSVAEAGSSGIAFPIAVVAGALLGLMLGAMVAIGLDRLDRRVAGASELENDLGVPILGDIPRITQDSPALVTAVSAHTPGAEAFRRVAAAALASRNGSEANSIAIVGANESEGRTTTTINLALAIAQTGREVLVVNTDRRNTTIDRIFGLAGETGLNDYLRTNKDREAAHAAIDNASRRVGIRLLSTGTGSEVSMSNSGIEELIAAAKERDMVVIFDTPPALTHAGGLQIAAIADSVLAVAASGRTRRSELAKLRTQLDNVQAYLTGAVFNRTSRLSLLPAGHGDIATVSVPTGVPGNSTQSDSPFQSPRTNGVAAPSTNGVAAPSANGVAAPSEEFVPQPPQIQAESQNGSSVGVDSVTTPNSTGVVTEPRQDYPASPQEIVDPQLAGVEREHNPANSSVASGYATQPIPGEAQPAVEKFANMQGLFREASDSDQ